MYDVVYPWIQSFDTVQSNWRNMVDSSIIRFVLPGKSSTLCSDIDRKTTYQFCCFCICVWIANFCSFSWGEILVSLRTLPVRILFIYMLVPVSYIILWSTYGRLGAEVHQEGSILLATAFFCSCSWSCSLEGAYVWARSHTSSWFSIFQPNKYYDYV